MRRASEPLGLALLLLIGLAAPATCEERPIGTGDLVRVTVFDNPELTTEARVGESGRIAFPLIGETAVVGLTAGQAQERIAALLRAGFIRNPVVTVTVVRRQIKIAVLGELVRTGSFEVPAGATLLEAVTAAGGLKPGAGEPLTLTRRAPASDGSAPHDEVFTFLLAELLEGRGPGVGFELAPGDSLFVPRSRERASVTVSLLGEFVKTGPVEVPEGARLLEVIALGGGLKPSAGETLILGRRAAAPGGSPPAEEQREVRLGELLEGRSTSGNIAVADGDSLYVPRASYVYVSGAVKSPGQYKIGAGLTVYRAIALAGGFTSRAAKGRVKLMRKREGGDVEVRARMDDPVLPDDVIVVPESFF